MRFTSNLPQKHKKMRNLIISLHLISFCHENPKICEINHSSPKKKPKEGEENISQKGEEKRKRER
jgi:hypothetical protein